MASETTTTSSKRRKTEQGIGTCLADLPIGILELTASFLAPPSRALFTISLTSDENNNPPSGNYSSIAGSDWDTLDFGEIEEEMATKLSDDDISAVLQHIDAVNNVKRLRLTNCIKITGAGLEPLRGSTIIEQIDLSLTGVGEKPRLDPWPPISCEAVLPVLHSIIMAERCSLKHLQFPFKWRDLYSINSEFHAFLVRYNEMREARDRVKCLDCNADLPRGGDEWINTRTGFGLHNFTCYQCTKHYCDGCERYCQRCQRDYCWNCVEVVTCHVCEDSWACEHCSKECNQCHQAICIKCVENNEGYACSFCDLARCGHCKNDVGMMQFCEECGKSCCNYCRLRKYQEGGSEQCFGCIKLLPHEVALVEQSNKRLQEEVEQLKNENSELRRLQGEMEQLKNENSELKRTQEEVEQLESENRELKLENKVLKDKEI